jgi:hypothetical protein
MMMPTVAMVVMVAVAAVRAAFGLEGGLHLHEICSKAMEHILDHMVGPNTKNVVSNFSRQVPVSQMPRKAHELMGIFVSDFDNQLRSSLNLQPPAVFQLQAISIGHGNRFRKVKKDIFSLIGSQANAAAMAPVKIESERACRFFLRPMPGGAMNGSALHCHPQYRK